MEGGRVEGGFRRQSIRHAFETTDSCVGLCGSLVAASSPPWKVRSSAALAIAGCPDGNLERDELRSIRFRHCQRSEAIHAAAAPLDNGLLRLRLAMTALVQRESIMI
jgi:hypothetical protein